MNRQREVIYSLRNDLLNGEDPRKDLWEMCDAVIEHLAASHPGAFTGEENAVRDLANAVQFHFGLQQPENESPDDWLCLTDSYEDFTQRLRELAEEAFDAKVNDLGEDLACHVMSHIMLQTVTTKWKDHLHTMDTLREGVGLRAYGQKDPLVEYQRESFGLFEDMYQSIQKDVVTLWFRIEVNKEAPPDRPRIPISGVRRRKMTAKERAAIRRSRRPTGDQEAEGEAAQQPTRLSRDSGRKRKIGRNDPCPCGSGKKYKKCCLEKEKVGAGS